MQSRQLVQKLKKLEIRFSENNTDNQITSGVGGEGSARNRIRKNKRARSYCL